MSQNHTGNIQPSIDNEEHDHLPGGVAVKKVGGYVFNPSLKEGLGDWERESIFTPTSTTIVTVGAVKTITETDTIRTRTTVIDATDPNNKSVTESWS